ncbi:hypothetical protein AUJ68_04250 [Candidatus Woesearchaeota archaeon CG1_02_57_44]|nr:MAG: hypothetical protein AUJ68_04250 [Candidatus Woesearchaeota archaeon CG1_02_57_44]
MIVMKFGGTSVGSPENIARVHDIVKGRIAKKPLVVVSAFSGVTDKLIEAGNEALKGNLLTDILARRHRDMIDELQLPADTIEPELRELAMLLQGISYVGEFNTKIMDRLQSFGERMSSKVVAAYFTSRGMPSTAVNASKAGMQTNDHYGSAEITPETYGLLREGLSHASGIQVVTGFIGVTAKGNVTTLGRGGSDYTASIIGAALGADEIEIWTDVNGVMTADPRIVPEAMTLQTISFDEAAELAILGAKVLHPKTIRPAVKLDIPVRVLNTNNPSHPGTVILKESQNPNFFTGIAIRKDILLINITAAEMLGVPGFLEKLFGIFSRHEVSVDFIATSEVSLSLTIDKQAYTEEIAEELAALGKVSVHDDKAMVAVVGNKGKGKPGMAAKVFGTLANADIPVSAISLCASRFNIACIVELVNAPKAMQILHAEHFVDVKK